eukprot:CAMPEP_0206609700 /NCGR_PEP_ID=MMETSP0325_2-20121206/53985_1 /ASSEMBLY_ACC=CAM_ASM_000347 /TAXON_ID=2866 /ORGANISM="Crypthecodinium cohnii, Strain Seligo" /LENGTH=199 /DNA_ID=CAMNT_0054128121 /DNA_START=46 /DNA_END=643 /DNA_ORIENTATION=+
MAEELESESRCCNTSSESEDFVGFLIDTLVNQRNVPPPSQGAWREYKAEKTPVDEIKEKKSTQAGAAIVHALDQGEASMRMSELEHKISLKRQANQALLRRVQMLEMSLHEERKRGETLVARAASPMSSCSSIGSSRGLPEMRTMPGAAAHAVSPQLPKGGLPGKVNVELLLQRCKNALSARGILEDALAAAEADTPAT